MVFYKFLQLICQFFKKFILFWQLFMWIILIILLPLIHSFAIVFNDTKADVIYFNGSIITLKNSNPEYVEAIATKNEKIIFIGKKEKSFRYRGENTQLNDLQGKTLLPGFIDAHSHFGYVSLISKFAQIFPPPDGKCDSFNFLKNILNQWIGANLDFINQAGMIIGFGYDDANLLEKQHPDRYFLDTINNEIPILIIHESSHLGVLNSKGLQYFNITQNTQDPAGGRYRRYPKTQIPTGVLQENAFFPVLGNATGRINKEYYKSMIIEAQQIYSSFGYTTAQDGRPMMSDVNTLIQIAQNQQLYLDIYIYPDYKTTHLNFDSNQWKPYIGKKYRNNLRIAGAKLAQDGSIQGKTGWLASPYYIAPQGQTLGYQGYPSLQFAELVKYANQILDKNLQLIVHTNGDAAIETYLNAVQEIRKNRTMINHEIFSNLDNIRCVSIHAQMCTQNQLQRMIKNKIIPSFFGEHTFYWGDWHYSETLGPQRAAKISPANTALSYNMLFTQHTDAPIVVPNPIFILWATVNRLTRSGMVLGEQQRISPYQALLSITKYAAYQIFEENEKGTLQVGKYADLIILDQDPLKINPLQLNELKILKTIKKGREIYRYDAKL